MKADIKQYDLKLLLDFDPILCLTDFIYRIEVLTMGITKEKWT